MRVTPETLLSDVALTADRRSHAQYTSNQPNGWFEVTIVHTGDPVGVLKFMGGNSSDEATHHDLALDDEQIFVNGADLANNAVTGLTYTTAATPGSLAVAATLAATVTIRVPIINAPAYVSLFWDHTSGGSSSSLLSATYYPNGVS